MNFDMRNPFHFHYSVLSLESNWQACHELEEITNEEGSLFPFSSIERGINEKLRSEVAGTEYPYEEMLTALTGKNKKQRTVKGKAVKFPQKLMYVLTCGDYDHIVHWKTNQTADSTFDDVFVISDIDAFTNEVLPSLFKVAKYESFQRKLYRWGFLKIQSSRCENNMKRSISYSHPLFKKGDFVLAEQMTCSGLGSILNSSRSLNPMWSANSEYSARETFSIAWGNCNFPKHERIQEENVYSRSTASNHFNERENFVVPTLNGLSVDQILENAYSVLKKKRN